MEKKQKRVVALGLLLLVLVVTAIVVIAILNKEYTITFHSDGGTSHEAMSVSRSNKNRPLPDPIKPGWTFMGWATSPSSNETYRTAEKIVGSTDMYAKWAPNNYVVNFYSDGARINSLPISMSEIRNGILSLDQSWILEDQTIRTFGGWSVRDLNGSEVLQLLYNSSGWSIKSQGGTAVGISADNPFKPSLYDNNVHAIWNYKTTRLVFLNEKGGTTAQGDKSVTFGASVKLNQFGTGETGYIGWRIDSNKISNSTLTVASTGVATTASKLNATQLAKVNSILSTTYSPGQEVVVDSLFAHLATRVVVDNGVVSNEVFDIYLYPVRYNENFTSRFYYENLTPIQNARTGTEPGIWFTSGGNNIVFNRPTDTDVTSYYYYHHQTGVRTTIEFGETLSTGTTGPFHQRHATIFYEERLGVRATVLFDYGLKCDGCRNGTDCSNQIHLIRELNISDEEKQMLAGIEATAIESSEPRPMGSTFTLPSASMYAMFNKNFIGWQEKESDGSLGRIYPAGTSYTIRADLANNPQRTYTLYAAWVDSRVNIIFDLDGGYGLNINALQGATVNLPQKDSGPFKTGYRFSHWIVNNDVNNKVEAGQTVSVTDGVKVLKAVWEAESVTVELKYTTRIGTSDVLQVFTNADLGGNLKFGDIITLPSITDTYYTGRYRHMGWTFETSGATYFTGTQVALNEAIVNTSTYRASATSSNSELGAIVRFFSEFSSGGATSTNASSPVGQQREYDLGTTLTSVELLQFKSAYEKYIPAGMEKTHDFKGFFIVPESTETLSLHIDTKNKYFDARNGAYGMSSNDLPSTSNGDLALFSDLSFRYELTSTSFSSITHFYMYLVPKAIEINVNNGAEKISSYYSDQRDRINLGSTSSANDSLGNWETRINAIKAGLTSENVFAGWEVEYFQNNQRVGGREIFPYSASASRFNVAFEENLKLLTSRLSNDAPIDKIQVKPIVRSIYDFIVYIVDDGTVSGGPGSIYGVQYKNVYGTGKANTINFTPENTTVQESLGAQVIGGFLNQLNRSGFVIDKFYTERTAKPEGGYNFSGFEYQWADIALGNVNTAVPAKFDATDGSIMLYAKYSPISYSLRIVNEFPASGTRNFAVKRPAELTSTYKVGQEFRLLPLDFTDFGLWLNQEISPRMGYYIDRNAPSTAFSMYTEAERLAGGANDGQFGWGASPVASLTLNSQQFDLSRAVKVGSTVYLDFYLVWQRTNVIINYTSGYADVPVSHAGTLKYGDSITLSTPLSTWSWSVPVGYGFDGWKIKLPNGTFDVIRPSVDGSVTLTNISSRVDKQLNVTENLDGSATFSSGTNAYVITLEASWTPREMNTITFNMKGNSGLTIESSFMRSEYSQYAHGSFTVSAGSYAFGESIPVAVGHQFENTPLEQIVPDERVFGGWFVSINGTEIRVDQGGRINLNNELFVDSNGNVRALEFYVKWIEVNLSVFDLDTSVGIVLDKNANVLFEETIIPNTVPIFTQIDSRTLNATALASLQSKVAAPLVEHNFPIINNSYDSADINTTFGLSSATRLAYGYNLVGFAVQTSNNGIDTTWHITTINGVSYSSSLDIGDLGEVTKKMTVIPVYKVIMITVRFDLGLGTAGKPVSAAEVKTPLNGHATTGDESRTTRHTETVSGKGTYQDYIVVPFDTLITLPYLTSQHATDAFDDLPYYVSKWQRTGVSPDPVSGGKVTIKTDDPYNANPTIGTEVVFRAVWDSASSLDVIKFSLAVPKAEGGYNYYVVGANPAVGFPGTAKFYKKPDSAPIALSPTATYKLPAVSDALISGFMNSSGLDLTGMAVRGWYMPLEGNNGPDLTKELIDGKMVRPCNELVANIQLTVYLVFGNDSGRVEFVHNNMNPLADMGVPGAPFYSKPNLDGSEGNYGVDTAFGAEVPLILNPANGLNPIIYPPTSPFDGWWLEFVGWERYHKDNAPNAERTVYNSSCPFKLGYKYENGDYVYDTSYVKGQTVTLYAVWNYKVVEISFYVDGHLRNRPNEYSDYNNGLGDFVNTNLGRDLDGVDGGGKYYLNKPLGVLPVPEITGYDFKYWTNLSGTIEYTENHVLGTENSWNARLYAYFEPNKFSFEFKTGATPATFTPPASYVPSQIPFVVSGAPGTIYLPMYAASDFEKLGVEFAGWTHDSNPYIKSDSTSVDAIDTTIGNVTVQLGTENKMINATHYVIDVRSAVKQPDGTYKITFSAKWSTESRIEVVYNTSGTRTDDAVKVSYGYLFNALRQPDKNGVTVGPTSADYMSYGIMIADDFGYNAPAQHNFAGWKVTSYNGKLPSEEGFPLSLKDETEGKTFFPGDFLPGNLNKSIELQAVWVPWTLEANFDSASVISLGVGSGYLAADYFENNRLVLGDNAEMVIVGQGFTRINQGAITAHNATRILLPSQGNLVLEPQSILAGGVKQIYISDNLRGGLLTGGTTDNVPNFIGGAIISPNQTLKIGGADVTNANAYNMIRSSMTHYLVKQGTAIYDFDNKNVNFAGGTLKYFYAEAAISPQFGVLMSIDQVTKSPKDLIAYPGAATEINIHSNVSVIKGFAFAYMSVTNSLTMDKTGSGTNLTNIEAYALFHSNIQILNLPSSLDGGFLDPAAVSGYLPRLSNVSSNNLATFTDGVLYHGAGTETSVMYITHKVNAASGNVSISGKKLTVSAGVTSIAPYALSSMYIDAATGNTVVTSLEILGSGTRKVLANGMTENPSDAEAGRLDLLHFGTDCVAEHVLDSIEIGSGIKQIDGRIFEGWHLTGGLILNDGLQDSIQYTAQTKNVPSEDYTYNRFPVLIRTTSSSVLTQFKTVWGAWAVTNSALQNNGRVQTLSKQVNFMTNAGTSGAPSSSAIAGVIPTSISVVYGSIIELPDLTAAGYVLLGWKAVNTNGTAENRLFQPGWTRDVTMLTTDAANYLTGTLYSERQITLEAQWGRVQVQFIDGLDKDVYWGSLGARIVTNTSAPEYKENDPTTWQTRPATGYDYAGKKVKADGTPELNAQGDLITIDSELVFVLPGWNSGIGSSGVIQNKAFVGWLKSSSAPASRDWDAPANASSADRILPDGAVLHKHAPNNEVVSFYALYDFASDNLRYEEVFQSIGGFRREVSARLISGKTGAVRIPAATYDAASGYMSAVTQISRGGFVQASLGAEVYIGSNVQRINDFAFQQSIITRVTFGHNSLPDAPQITIGNNAFSGSWLETIVLPSRLVSIGASAFSTSRLVSATMDNSSTPILKTIGDRAFWQCEYLRTLFAIPSTVVYNAALETGIGYLAFARTMVEGYTTVNTVKTPNTYVAVNGNLCFIEADGRIRLMNYAAGKVAEAITSQFFISNEIVLVGDYAFSYSRISSITIPAQSLISYARLGINVFDSCQNLNYIALETTSPTNLRMLPNGDAKEIFRGMATTPSFYVSGALDGNNGWRTVYDYINPASFFAWGSRPGA